MDLERLTLSPELERILAEAEDIARQIRVQPHSLHVLLAMFTVDNPARHTLTELGIDEDRLIELCDPKAREPRTTIRKALTRAATLAAGCGAERVEALHLLVALTREPKAVARSLLEATEQPLVRIRSTALAQLTHKGHRWVQEAPQPEAMTVVTSRARSAVVHASTSLPGRPARPSKAPPAPARATSGGGDAPWELDRSVFPWLTSLGRNLTAEAARGDLDPLIGRTSEIAQLMDILGKRRANNPCLIGEPGVGKTAVVEGLAIQALQAPPGSRPRRWVVIALDVGRLLVGTHLRGSFSEKLQGLQEEVRKSDGRVIVFIDELHTLVGAGSSEGSPDASQELKAALARGQFPCIGATTLDEYQKSIASDPALVRRFVPVRVDEPTVPESIELLGHVAPQYAAHHSVAYAPEALQAAVRLTARYLPEQRLPDKAIAIVDLAGSRAARAGQAVVDPDLVADIVGERVGLSGERLRVRDRERLLKLDEQLARKVVGHRRQLERIAQSIQRNAAGFRGERPQGVFLLLGPTGVGKTEVARVLADELHGPGSLLRFDLNEFTEAHSASRLVGAPPGYVGHESGGQLTDAVRRRPGRVILFDEVEKAHPEVLNLLLRVLDEGRLTDARGITVSFTESILILTSNAGAEGAGRSLGFGSDKPSDTEARLLERARAHFTPELWGRVSEKLVFAPLTRDEAMEVARRMAQASSQRLEAERGIRFELDAKALRYLLDQGGFDPEQGARPLRAVLARLVEGTIARRILEGRLHADEEVWVTVRDGGLCFQVGELRESLSKRPASR